AGLCRHCAPARAAGGPDRDPGDLGGAGPVGGGAMIRRAAGPVTDAAPMRDRRSQLTIAAVAFLLGLLVVVQLRAQTAGSALQNQSAQDLTNLVGNLNTQNDRLRSEVSVLQGQLEELRADHAVGATSVGQIQ